MDRATPNVGSCSTVAHVSLHVLTRTYGVGVIWREVCSDPPERRQSVVVVTVGPHETLVPGHVPVGWFGELRRYVGHRRLLPGGAAAGDRWRQHRRGQHRV